MFFHLAVFTNVCFADSLRTLEFDHLRQSELMKEQMKLVERLENDLYNLRELGSPGIGKDGLSHLTLSEPDFITDALRSESANIPPANAAAAREASGGGGGETALFVGQEPDFNGRDARLGPAYLPILERQHERFHAKIKDLEVVNHELKSSSIALKTEVGAVKADNVRLYERIRFLQSYDGRKSTNFSGERAHVSLSGATATDAESRYSSVYEANLDPFSTFHRAEKQRRYDALGPVDKTTLAMGTMVLGSPVSRKIFFVYALLLHLLIFAVVYKMAWSESSLRDFSYDCTNKFADHMEKVHGHDQGNLHHH